jgi:hypothetical protein
VHQESTSQIVTAIVWNVLLVTIVWVGRNNQLVAQRVLRIRIQEVLCLMIAPFVPLKWERWHSQRQLALRNVLYVQRVSTAQTQHPGPYPVHWDRTPSRETAHVPRVLLDTHVLIEGPLGFVIQGITVLLVTPCVVHARLGSIVRTQPILLSHVRVALTAWARQLRALIVKLAMHVLRMVLCHLFDVQEGSMLALGTPRAQCVPQENTVLMPQCIHR